MSPQDSPDAVSRSDSFAIMARMLRGDGRLALMRRGAGGVLAALGVALLAFDDVQPLRAIGGGALASPGWIPLLAATALLVVDSDLARRRIIWIGCLAIAGYAVLLSLVTAIIDPAAAYGQSPLEKALPALGSFLVWLLVLIGGYVLASTVPRQLLVGAGIMFAIMAVGALLYRVGIHFLDDLPLIHSAANEQQRVRSTRFEASSLGGGMLASTAIAVALIRQARRRFFAALGGLLATVVLTDSRGTELIAAAGLVLLLMLSAAHLRPIRLSSRTVVVVSAIVTAVALTISLGLAFVVQSQLWHTIGLSDGSRGTSDATRAGWAYAASHVLGTSPLGLGFAAYLQETPALLHQAISALSTSYGPSALSELVISAEGVSDTGVSPKTAPTLAAFHLGWVGLLALGALWTVMLVRSYDVRPTRSGSPAAFVTTACVILVASTYYASLTAWEQALLAGAVIGIAAVGRRRHRLVVATGRETRAG